MSAKEPKTMMICSNSECDFRGGREVPLNYENDETRCPKCAKGNLSREPVGTRIIRDDAYWGTVVKTIADRYGLPEKGITNRTKTGKRKRTDASLKSVRGESGEDKNNARGRERYNRLKSDGTVGAAIKTIEKDVDVELIFIDKERRKIRADSTVGAFRKKWGYLD